MKGYKLLIMSYGFKIWYFKISPTPNLYLLTHDYFLSLQPRESRLVDSYFGKGRKVRTP